jgi:hypothetical protein
MIGGIMSAMTTARPQKIDFGMRDTTTQAQPLAAFSASVIGAIRRGSIWRNRHYLVRGANLVGARVSVLTGDLKEERLTRKRLAAEEGAKALEEVAKKAVDVRADMARLRALRLAKEAQEVRTEISTSNQTNKTKP